MLINLQVAAFNLQSFSLLAIANYNLANVCKYKLATFLQKNTKLT